MAFEDLRIDMKCKDFRIEIEEGLKGDSLSIAAQDHAAGCRPCHEFNHKHIELREWIAVCQQITAPKDFQFGVQRKIANAEGVHAHNWAWNGLKYIVPTAALVLFAVLTWNFLSTSATQTGTPLAVINAEVPEVKDPTQVQPGPPSDVITQPQEQLATSANRAENNNGRVTVPKDEKGGGSLVQGANDIPPPVMPQGLPNLPNKKAVQSNMLSTLLKLGVVTNLEMHVTRVLPDTPGARAGVKEGDVVQGFSGSVVTILRGEQTLQLTLK